MHTNHAQHPTELTEQTAVPVFSLSSRSTNRTISIVTRQQQREVTYCQVPSIQEEPSDLEQRSWLREMFRIRHALTHKTPRQTETAFTVLADWPYQHVRIQTARHWLVAACQWMTWLGKKWQSVGLELVWVPSVEVQCSSCKTQSDNDASYTRGTKLYHTSLVHQERHGNCHWQIGSCPETENEWNSERME